jgi:hypothetical protein
MVSWSPWQTGPASHAVAGIARHLTALKSRTHQRRSWSHGEHLDKKSEARQGPGMAFGPFRAKAKFGETNIATSAAAMAFVRSLETALDAMVWEGLKRNDAAKAAGLAESSLRFALRKPHVLA